jgi:hypothetical protein
MTRTALVDRLDEASTEWQQAFDDLQALRAEYGHDIHVKFNGRTRIGKRYRAASDRWSTADVVKSQAWHALRIHDGIER